MSRSTKWVLIIVAAIVVVFLVLTGAIPTASVATAQARPGRVITDPAKITSRTPIIDIQATVRAKRMSPAIARRLVRVGKPHRRISITGRGLSIVRGNATNGCAGTVVKTAKVYIFVKVVLAWRKAVQHGWCWDASKITVIGAHEHFAWKASGYCWSNVTWKNSPWSGYPGRWWEYRLLDAASLHVNVPLLGCDAAPLVDSFRYLREPIFYRRAGRYNFG